MGNEDKKLLMEAWRQVVQTQMHFNELGLKIRNFAFVLTGAFIALGGYALREGGKLGLPFADYEISIASAIIFASVVPLCGVFFMDRKWYHPLLIGSVIEGSKIEKKLSQNGIPLSLGAEISWQSGSFGLTFGEKKLFSAEEKERYEREIGLDWTQKWEKEKDKFVLMDGPLPIKTFRSHNKMNTFYMLLIGAMLVLGFLIHEPNEKKLELEEGESSVVT